VSLFEGTGWTEAEKQVTFLEMQLDDVARVSRMRDWQWNIAWLWAQVAQTALCYGWTDPRSGGAVGEARLQSDYSFPQSVACRQLSP